jgi:hypothetical protein
MSVLKVDTVTGPVRVAYPSAVYAPGHIVQVQYNVAMQRYYYTVPNNDGGLRGGNFAEGSNEGGVIVRPLDISIKPRSVDSFIFVEFNVFYECANDIVFSILRDGNTVGAAQPDASVIGFYGASKQQGLGVATYDNNNDSTPHYINLPWVDRPGTTEWVTYNFAVKSSNSSQHSFILNATYTNYQNGADNYEQGVSFAIAQEIAY